MKLATQKRVNFADGSYYVGEANERGEQDGRGVLKWTDGGGYYYYFGDWKNGKKNGKGIQYSLHSIYEGDWKHNKMCGRGFSVYVDGSTYQGEFRDGCPHGYGLAEYPDGSRVEGNWVSGHLNGWCVIHFSREDKRDFYKGEMKDGVWHGRGEIRWKDGDRMVAEWVSGLRHGEATYYWANGSVWKGQFVSDKREGWACRVDATFGYTFEGYYCNDSKSDGRIRWLNGDSWVGRYISEDVVRKGQWLSEGVMTFAQTGNTMKGQWLDDSMKNGKGKMVMWIKEENKEVIGEWIDGSFRPLNN